MNLPIANGRIQILKPVDLLLPSPVDDQVCRGVLIEPIKRLNELHFVIRGCDGDPARVVHAGHESAICLQVVEALPKLCRDKEVQQLYFYANYGGSWKRISFKSFDHSLVKLQWPQCDRGEAFGGIDVTTLSDSDIENSALTTDSLSPAFPYWWQHIKTLVDLKEETENDIHNELARVSRLGTHDYDDFSYRFLFAVEKSELLRQIKEIKSRTKIYKKSKIYPGYGDVGCCCFCIYWKFEGDTSQDEYQGEYEEEDEVKSEFLNLHSNHG